MESEEKIMFSNRFGKVTDKRVVLNYKSGTEDIIITKISSISLQRRRNYFLAILGYGLGLFMLFFVLENMRNTSGMEVLILILVAIVGFVSGFANWIGNHDIVISTSGQNRKPLNVEFSKTMEGKQFVDAVRRVVFK